MGYAKNESPVPVIVPLEYKKEEYDEALKMYQGEVLKIQEQKAVLLKEIEVAEGQLAGVRDVLAQAQESLNHVQEVRRNLEADIERERKKFQSECDALALDQDSKFKAEREQIEGERAKIRQETGELEALRGFVGESNKALSERETELNRLDKHVTERLQVLNERDKKQEELIASLEAGKNALAEATEKMESWQKRLQEKETLHAVQVSELKQMTAKLNDDRAKLDADQAQLRSIDEERKKLDAEKKDFQDASARMEMRGAALDELENRLRNWESDLKKQEDLLINKVKGV